MSSLNQFVNIYKAILFFSNPDKSLSILNPGFLIVSDTGKIIAVTELLDFDDYPDHDFHDFSNHLICPGLIDLHTHLAQLPIIGQGADTLFDWLNNYTYPIEKKFSDNNFAERVSQLFFKTLIANGTTCAAVYPSTHKEATNIAFQSAADAGIRLIMGKVIMTRNAPDSLIEDYRKSHDDCIELIQRWHRYDNDRIQYAITPRFAINCTINDMEQLAQIALKYNTFIQTHLAETREELELVKRTFPEYNSYTELYDSVGLLNGKSLLAHCIYLSDNEEELLVKRKSIVVHCPSSNRFLQSGLFPFRKREKEKLNLAIGTDIAGGYNLSMFAEIRETIETSKIINFNSNLDKTSVLSQSEAFYYATLGAAKAIGLQKSIGTFSEGLDADFIIIDDENQNPFFKEEFFNTIEHRISKLIYQFNSSYIKSVFVRGKCLK